MNLYVPVAFPPNMLKLLCFCVSSCKGTWLYAYFRSIFENSNVRVFCLSSLILHAIVSIRWSILCIWYLFLCIASFNFFESSAIFMDLSCFTVITTGLMKYSSEHLSNLIICLSSMSLFISLSTLSIRWSRTRLPLCCVGGISYGMWILLCGFLIFRFLYISRGIFRISISLCCFVLVVCYVFSHPVFCRIIRSRVFGGCPFLVDSLCFARQQGFGSCVPLCRPLLDPVGLSSLFLFCYC